MPLRCLEYVSRLYETLFESKEKYSRKLLKIPTPEFYVFYNGQDAYPCKTILKLSNAFIEKVGEAHLELTVKVININQHDKHPVLANCQTMKEYSIFVETVRKWKEIDQINGFEKAIEECIANNILREYLKRKSKEVVNMLLAEYDYETDIAVQRAEEREIAFDEGLVEGKSLGLVEGEARGTRRKALETAQLMRQRNYPSAEICLITGLSEAEVEGLR